MKTALAALIVGYGLDLLLGDPSFLYHPIRVIGNLIALLEKWLRKVFPKTPKGELAGGCLLYTSSAGSDRVFFGCFRSEIV